MVKNTRKPYNLKGDDDFTLLSTEMEVYHAILKETVLKNQRCATLSLSQLSKMTGIPALSSVDYQLRKLKKRKMIEIKKDGNTNSICLTIDYKEYFKI